MKPPSSSGDFLDLFRVFPQKLIKNAFIEEKIEKKAREPPFFGKTHEKYFAKHWYCSRNSLQ